MDDQFQTTAAKCELCDDPAVCDRHGRCLEFEAPPISQPTDEPWSRTTVPRWRNVDRMEYDQ